MSAPRSHDVLVIGAGQHGLSASYWLKRRGIDHAVLERDRIGSSWRRLWDGFRTNTPKAFNRLPGLHYDGPDPQGFSTREEVTAFLEEHARRYDLPVHCSTTVERAVARGGGFRVQTSRGDWNARALVVANGPNGHRRDPRFDGSFPAHMATLHTADYRNPRALPPGAVLVVGGGQSGVQIAEELREAGRQVYLSVTDRPSNLRRFRGKDFMELWEAGGVLHQRFEDHPSIRAGDPQAKRQLRKLDFPLVSGTDGGHMVSLRALSESGVTLLGRLRRVDGDVASFADLEPDLQSAHEATRTIRRELVAIAERCYPAANLEPPEPLPDDLDWFPAGTPGELHLRRAGVSTVILCGGYSWDWTWLDVPHVFDEMGYPLGQRGISPHPGLFFLGLFFLQRLSTTCLCNGGQDAADIVEHLDGFLRARAPERCPRHQRAARRLAVVLPTPQDRDELAALQGTGLVVDHLTSPEWTPFMSASPGFDVAGFTARSIRHARQERVDAVLASHDLGALVASAVSEHARLPGPSVESSFLCVHKAYSRAVERNPIRHRAYDLATDGWWDGTPLPCHVKPATLMFSVLQRSAFTAAEVERAVREIRREGPAWSRAYREFAAAYVDTVRYPLAERDVVVVEELVKGASQHAVEGWTDADGRHTLWAVSDNNYTAGPAPSLDSNSVPSRLMRPVADRVVAVAFDTVSRHGISSSFWNVELWVRPDGDIRVTEVNGRMIASMTPLYRTVLGQSQYPAAVALACGDPATASALGPSGPRGVGAMFSVATARGGSVRDAVRWREVRRVSQMDGVVKLALMQTPDTEITWTQTGGVFCVARAYLVGNSYGEIYDKAAAIRARLIVGGERMAPDFNDGVTSARKLQGYAAS